MPIHDISYKHWDGVHLGVWRRRLAIARNGLGACLRNRWMRHVIVLCWAAGLAMTAALFFIGQLLVADSLTAQTVGHFELNLQTFARMLTSWLEQRPETSVGAVQNVLFYYFGAYLMRGSIFAIGMAIPLLITRDLASNAIVIYSSKAVSRGDYLLGKFSAAFGLLSLTWLGPVCAAWLTGNLLAPDWRFFWHSRMALFHILIYGTSSMILLSLLAMGVSAVSSKEKSTAALWYSWWIIGGVIAPIAAHTEPWLRHISFNYNLDQIALAVFRVGGDLAALQDNIPIFGEMLRHRSSSTIAALNHPTIQGAAAASALMLGLAGLIIRHRVKPE